MTTHELKTWPGSFKALVKGAKTHEVRPADRNFQIGDVLHLREWIPSHEDSCNWDSTGKCTKCGRAMSKPLPGTYTGEEARFEVTYLTSGGRFGLPPDLCVLSVRMFSLPAQD